MQEVEESCTLYADYINMYVAHQTPLCISCMVSQIQESEFMAVNE